MTYIKSIFQAVCALSCLASYAYSSPLPSVSSCVPLSPIFPSNSNTLISSEIHVLDGELGYSIPLKLDGVSQTFNLLMDTISFISFAKAQNCKTCGNRTALPIEISTDGTSTFTFNTLLGNESVAVSMAGSFSTVMGGINTNLSLYAATEVDNLTASAPFDGVMGLALGPHFTTVLPGIAEQLASEGKISNPTLTFKLPSISNTSASGLVLFGDASSFLANSTRVTQQNATANGFWDLQGIPSVNERPIFATNSTRKARIDTRENKIAIPASDMQALIASIPEAQVAGGGFTLPCNATTRISFDVSGKQFMLRPEHFISTIQTKRDPEYCFTRFGTLKEDGLWFLGSPFTSSFYVSLDYANDSITIADL